MPIDLPENFEAPEDFAKYEDTAALANAYRHLEKKLGSMLPTPTTEEGMSALMTKLGAKDSPGEYNVPIGVDPKAVENLRDFAVKAQLTQEQFNKMAEQTYEKDVAAVGARNEAVSRVQAEYGDKFEEAQARVARALQILGPEKAAAYDANDPAIFRLLDTLGAQAGGTTQAAPQAQAAPIDSFDPHSVAAEGRKIMNSDAFQDRNHPEHQLAREEYGKRAFTLMQKGFEGVYDAKLQPAAGMFG